MKNTRIESVVVSFAALSRNMNNNNNNEKDNNQMWYRGAWQIALDIKCSIHVASRALNAIRPHEMWLNSLYTHSDPLPFGRLYVCVCACMRPNDQQASKCACECVCKSQEKGFDSTLPATATMQRASFTLFAMKTCTSPVCTIVAMNPSVWWTCLDCGPIVYLNNFQSVNFGLIISRWYKNKTKWVKTQRKKNS